MFDRKNDFKEHVLPLVEQINRICSFFKIPYFYTFCVEDDGKNTTYYNSVGGSVSAGIQLTEDQIVKHLNVANGFDTIPQRSSANFDDFDMLSEEICDDDPEE